MAAQTELEIERWSYGTAQAERMCAEILSIEGYDSIDPQCPLGGPDGGKDILCERGGRQYLAACYFPTTGFSSDYLKVKDIKKKLVDDSAGVAANGVEAMVFFVNQRLTPTERAELVGAVQPIDVEIYHHERIRSVLDSPKGYGTRLNYLRVSMSNEEQIGLLSVINFKVDERLKHQSRELAEIRHALQHVRMRTDDIAGFLTDQPSSLDAFKERRAYELPTAELSVGQLKWLHRIVTDDSPLPLALRGTFRNVAVHIGPGGGVANATFIPPAAAEVPDLVENLLHSWRLKFPSLIGAPEEDVVQDLAIFHRGILAIHPFMDANGRVARAILQQQAFELLGKWISAKFTEEPHAYYSTLAQGDKGDLEPLKLLIHANLE